MNTQNSNSSIAQVKERDMVAYLETLGHYPAKVRTDDYWYLSPLRNEKTPSFKVNLRIKRWYDHGLGKGGSIIDFGMLYFNCSLVEFLSRLDKNIGTHQPSNLQSERQVAEPKIKI